MVDLARIQRDLGVGADVVLVTPRVLRQVVKVHRSTSAVGVVPHARCYALSRPELRDLAVDLGPVVASGSPYVILVSEPTASEQRGASPDQLHEQIFRLAFHASVHLRFDRLVRHGKLTDADVQRRVERLGRAEFHEIRAIVTHDELLLPPGRDLEVYVEFGASYLELRRFAPELVAVTFPGLAEPEDIEAVLREDVDVEALLAVGEPDVAIPLTVRRPSTERRAAEEGPAVSEPRRARLVARSRVLAARGAHAAATRAAARALGGSTGEARRHVEEALDDAAGRLAFRLEQALGGPLVDDAGQPAPWRAPLMDLARRDARRSRFRSRPESAVLRELERAVAAWENPGVIVDGASWLLSRGQRPAVRPRKATRELQVARIIDAAAERVQHVELRPSAQSELARLMKAASLRAEERVRRALRPRIVRTLERARMVARSEAERLSRDKLVEELLDQIIARGFLSLAHLRDAVSENQLKLPDLDGPGELLRGDAILRADARLAVALDGIYRRGDVYLRLLQKLSSLPFGTRVGRGLALFVVLPAIGAFTVLEGTRQLVNPLLARLFGSALPPVGWVPLAVATGVIVALLHSEAARVLARQLLDLLGILLAWVLFRIPRALLTLPWVVRFLELPVVRAALRRAIVPGALAGAAYAIAPVYGVVDLERVGVSAGSFVLASLLFGSRLGWWLEGLFFERIAPTWHVLSRQWLPGLLRMLGSAFAALMDGVDRRMHQVQDLLRFHRTRSTPLLALAGALGALWALVAYVVRVYMTLLVEPELNPLKHFPVVTVAHKLLLPFLPELLRALERPFSVLGPVVGGAGAAVTAFLLPSVFGFLAWELKENYRIYRATRAARIEAARFGPDGETMRGLLVAGVHSGTIPKLYDRLRHAAHRQRARDVRLPGRTGGDASTGLGRFHEGRRVLTRALTRFAERELVPRVVSSPRWTLGGLLVRHIGLSSNRVRIRIGCDTLDDDDDCEVAFEQLGGTIVASLPRPGFVARLDPPQALLFENALAVFYHRAEVSLVREQVEGELGRVAHYDVSGDDLVVWPDEDYRTELSYRIETYRPRQLRPRVTGEREGVDARNLDSQRVLFWQQRFTWQSWERAFGSAVTDASTLPRLVSGPPLLPTGLAQAVAPAVDRR